MKGPHVFLTTPELEQRTIKRKTDVIIFSVNEAGKLYSDFAHYDPSTKMFKIFNLGLKQHERAFILNIKTLYSHNDFDESFTFNCELPNKDYCVIVIPGSGFRGVIDPNCSLVYEPNMINMNINMFPYIGIEHLILEKRSSCITLEGIDTKSYDTFYFTDPIVVFLLNYRHKFDTLRSDDILQSKEDPKIYLIKRSLVENVQRVFKNAVFPLFNYKTDNYFYLELKPEPKLLPSDKKFVMMQVQIEFMVLAPQMLMYEVEGIKLNF